MNCPNCKCPWAPLPEDFPILSPQKEAARVAIFNNEEIALCPMCETGDEETLETIADARFDIAWHDREAQHERG